MSDRGRMSPDGPVLPADGDTFRTLADSERDIIPARVRASMAADRLPLDATLMDVMVWYYGMFPPVQCAPAVGVHQGCEHAEQSPPAAHFTIDAGGTCTRNSRPAGRCLSDCCASATVGGWAELVESTVTPPVYVPRMWVVAHQSPATARHVTRGC